MQMHRREGGLRKSSMNVCALNIAEHGESIRLIKDKYVLGSYTVITCLSGAISVQSVAAVSLPDVENLSANSFKKMYRHHKIPHNGNVY